MTCHKHLPIWIKPHRFTTGGAGWNPRLHHFDITSPLLRNSRSSSALLVGFEVWSNVIWEYPNPWEREEAGESNLVEVRKDGGWLLVGGGGWGVGVIFSREWERWEATSIFFFFAWEDLKFCGSSKEGCGWAGHILTNQSCALAWVSWLDLTHDPNGSSFIYLPFFCFP